MQSAIFLYEKGTGNLIGKKGTKDNFLKYMEATKRDEMISYVKSVKEGNGNTRSNYSSSDGSPTYGHNFTTPETSIQRIHTNSNSTIRIYNMPLKNLEKPVVIYGSHLRSEDFWIFSFFVYVSNGKVEVEKNINKLRAFYNHKYFLKDNKNFVDFGIIIYDANTKEIVYKNANRSKDITDYMDKNYTKQIVEFMERYETISSQEYKRSSSY